MKFLSLMMALVVSATLIILVGCTRQEAKTKWEPQQTAYVLLMVDGGGNQGKCSASAVGPSTFVTATHCTKGMVAAKLVDEEGHELLIVKPTIKDIQSDGRDHTLIQFNKDVFTSWGRLVQNAKVTRGERLQATGNPGAASFVYTEGTVAFMNKTPDFIGLNLPSFKGDSGASIYRFGTGDIISVCSAIYAVTDKESGMQVQWTIVRTFKFKTEVLEAMKVTHD